MNIVDGIVVAALAAYLGAVAWKGRAGALGQLLKDESGFVVFALSAGALYAIYQWKGTHPIGRGLILIAGGAFALRAVANPNTQELIKAWQAGGGAWRTILGGGSGTPASAPPAAASAAVPAGPLALPALPELTPGPTVLGGPSP